MVWTNRKPIRIVYALADASFKTRKNRPPSFTGASVYISKDRTVLNGLTYKFRLPTDTRNINPSFCKILTLSKTLKFGVRFWEPEMMPSFTDNFSAFKVFTKGTTTNDTVRMHAIKTHQYVREIKQIPITQVPRRFLNRPDKRAGLTHKASICPKTWRIGKGYAYKQWSPAEMKEHFGDDKNDPSWMEGKVKPGDSIHRWTDKEIKAFKNKLEQDGEIDEIWMSGESSEDFDEEYDGEKWWTDDEDSEVEEENTTDEDDKEGK